MDNFLINFLMQGCNGSVKGCSSQGKTNSADGNAEGGNDFFAVLCGKMGEDASSSLMNMLNNAMTLEGSLSEAAGKAESSDGVSATNVLQKDDGKNTNGAASLTQSLLASLQALFNRVMSSNDVAADVGPVQASANGEDLKSAGELLKGIMELLKEGESVQFGATEKGKNLFASLVSLIQGGSKADSKEGLKEGATENTATFALPADLFKVPEENIKDADIPEKTVQREDGASDRDIMAAYLASIVNGAVQATEKTDNGVSAEASQTGTTSTDKTVIEELGAKAEDHKVKAQNKKMFTLFPKAAVQVASQTSSEAVSGSDEAEKAPLTVQAEVPLPKIEIKKMGDGNNQYQILAGGALSAEEEKEKDNITVLSAKIEKANLSGDEKASGVASRVPEKEPSTASSNGEEERQMLSQNDYAKVNNHKDAVQAAKAVDKNAFGAMMADRIEKITEQFAVKSASMDMVVRLKIDDKETLLVGLRDQGQRIAVDVKTTNETMGNFLQAQKDIIIKQLENKQIYTNIYVDINNEQQQKKEQKGNGNKKDNGPENQDFVGFIEAMA